MPLDGHSIFSPTAGMRYEKVGRYHNYHFTTSNFDWPEISRPIQAVIDGFSPNLNKTLHIGHLRNLALGSALVKVTGTENSPVAMLGAALGTSAESITALANWYALANYSPTMYYDTGLVALYDLNPALIETKDGNGEQAGCKVWHGPKGPVIVRKSDGSCAYAAHDLLFAKLVTPTHYVTADEQRGHFESVGLKDKHLPMGLVQGVDGKKIKSRTGDAMMATDALDLVKESLGEGAQEKLAWNVLAWNFLSVSRTQNVKFIPELWANPDRGGLYISYTLARVKSALQKAEIVAPSEVLEVDVPLYAISSYFHHYLKAARDTMDPCPIANYAFMLAKAVGSQMEKQRVIGGTPSFQFAMVKARSTLQTCMELLTMYPLDEV